MDPQPADGILEEFRIEFLDCWRRLPNKGFFLALLAAWLGIFHFLGNSALGYIRTSSLLTWLYVNYTIGGNLLDSEGGYCLLVLPVVLVLFWLKRRKLTALDLGTWWPGLLLLGLGLLIHIFGYLNQEPHLSVFGLITGLYGLTGLAWGRAWLKASFFPFFLLLFCIPLGSLVISVTFRLRLLVCQLVELVSHYILAVDIERRGTQLVDPTGHYQYEVAAACSGIRSLSATMVLAVILAFVSPRSWWKRLVIIGSAFPLAVLGNLLRMLAIIIAAEMGGQEWGNWVHEGGPMGIFVLLLYVPAFIILLALDRYLGERPAAPGAAPPQPKAV